MSTMSLARLLGWFSLALGALEIAIPATLSRWLGLTSGPWLVRSFGVREVVAGLAVLAKPEHPFGASSRVAGDVLDAAVLVPRLSANNPQRGAAWFAFALVLGIAALDVLCASALVGDERRRAQTARRTHAAVSERVVRT